MAHTAHQRNQLPSFYSWIWILLRDAILRNSELSSVLPCKMRLKLLMKENTCMQAYALRAVSSLYVRIFIASVYGKILIPCI